MQRNRSDGLEMKLRKFVIKYGTNTRRGMPL
jgi:hypothetical protein